MKGTFIAKGLKLKQDSATGEWKTPVKAEIYFPDNTVLSDVSQWNGKEVNIGTESEHELTDQEIRETFDGIQSAILKLASLFHKREQDNI